METTISINSLEKKRVMNKTRMSRMKTEVKKLMAAVEPGDKGKATELLPLACCDCQKNPLVVR